MALMSFIKGAGEKLFGHGTATATAAAPATASAADQIDALGREAAQAISAHVLAQGLKVEGMQVGFDASSGTVTAAGTVTDQATKEKVLL